MAARKKATAKKAAPRKKAAAKKAAPRKTATAKRTTRAPKKPDWIPQNPDRPGRIITPVSRCSFVKVFKADEDGNYSIVQMFPKETTDMTDIEGAIEHVLQESYKGKKAGIHMPIRDGDDPKDTYSEYDGFEGMWIVRSKTSFPPGVVDKQLQDIIDPSEFYSGAWARCSITCYAYENSGNKGISFALNNVQKIKDDESLGGAQAASNEFGNAEEVGDEWQEDEEELEEEELEEEELEEEELEEGEPGEEEDPDWEEEEEEEEEVEEEEEEETPEGQLEDGTDYYVDGEGNEYYYNEDGEVEYLD